MGEFDLPKQELIKRMSPEDRLRAVGTPLGLSTTMANRITKARLQLALSQLAEGSVDEVQAWLREVAKTHPAEAIRLYLELLEFQMPRLKGATVIANLNPPSDGTGDLAGLSIEELARVVAEG